ncbi:transporter substrate-binding domain-containing protein [Agrobacterium tumefaciens]|uniref:Transporter substrate-binding domain-containing protein n=1 Tax=Agrobacterium tumefaciens TaxID=358 RepID=A0AAP9E8L9_AGRTU|nr:transporter substrate-binding domain-containing protein [Agrobacterium tumefaciens]MCW8060248.1 transporter substrate-binding domain-containing protein [Agrobacterium tumefaciens]MCW8147036.1 transporter substrate-binding domain-containing protein [Agrobacterium tumefaciens]MQB40031.1 ABC transporter substrate-binding protein [Agrobacterium tumefaciens]NSX99757.1 transporter substrate-binding domain-containing protein [Agrobacterium tumefaciens]NSZ61240.1 transporter substrate-binding domai
MRNTAFTLSRSKALGGLTAVLLAATSFATSALAVTPEEIKAKGTATIGVQMDQFPWGFIDAKGQNDGFDIEIANMIAKELGVEVKFERITGQNRIPLLVNGNVDFLVPSMTITEERAKVIQYVIPYSSNDITVWGKKDVDIKANEDLGKFVIGVNRGSAFEPLLVKVAPPNTQIKRFDDDATTVQALLSGQVDAILGSVTYGIVIKQAGYDAQFDRKYKVADNFQGMAVRKGDQELLDYLTDFVSRHTADGTLDAAYKKWIGVDRAKLPTTLPGVDFTGKQ